MPFTVKRALQELAKYNGQSGSCWDDPSNLKRLNRVRENIYLRTDCEGTIDWICPQVNHGCFYLPIQFSAIRSAYLCNKSVRINNRFYSAIDRGVAQSFGPMGKATIQATGKTSSFFLDITEPIQIIVSCEQLEDEGKKIFFWGGANQSTDKNEVALSMREVPVSGNFDRSVPVTKEITLGSVNLWAFAAGSRGQLLASYPGGIEVPKYVQYSSSISGNAKSLVLCVKKQCFPLYDHDQPVDIESLTALEFAYQAMNKMDDGDDAGFASKVKLMHESLNKADISLQVEAGNSEASIEYASHALPR